jgi:hypothetical protein
VPFEDAPISDEDRRRNREWFAEDDLLIRRVSDEALAGNNPNASLAIVTHLGLRTAIFGADDVVEAEAMKWLTLAAQQGHPEAFRILGHRNAAGHGVAQDYAEAAKWFDLGRAAQRSDLDDRDRLSARRRARASQDWAVAIRWWTTRRTACRLPRVFRRRVRAAPAWPRSRAGTRHLQTDRSRSSRRPASSWVTCMSGDAPRPTTRRPSPRSGAPPTRDTRRRRSSSAISSSRDAAASRTHPTRYWARLAERRLPSGALKTRADESARAAAGLMSAVEIAAGDDRVKAVMEAGAKPVR